MLACHVAYCRTHLVPASTKILDNVSLPKAYSSTQLVTASTRNLDYVSLPYFLWRVATLIQRLLEPELGQREPTVACDSSRLVMTLT